MVFISTVVTLVIPRLCDLGARQSRTRDKRDQQHGGRHAAFQSTDARYRDRREIRETRSDAVFYTLIVSIVVNN